MNIKITISKTQETLDRPWTVKTEWTDEPSASVAYFRKYQSALDFALRKARECYAIRKAAKRVSAQW